MTAAGRVSPPRTNTSSQGKVERSVRCRPRVTYESSGQVIPGTNLRFHSRHEFPLQNILPWRKHPKQDAAGNQFWNGSAASRGNDESCLISVVSSLLSFPLRATSIHARHLGTPISSGSGAPVTVGALLPLSFRLPPSHSALPSSVQAPAVPGKLNKAQQRTLASGFLRSSRKRRKTPPMIDKFEHWRGVAESLDSIFDFYKGSSGNELSKLL